MSRIVTGVADAQQQNGKKQSWSLLREFAASGISVGCANTVLNPVEVIKTRMQLNGAGAVGSPASAAAAAAAAPPPLAPFTATAASAAAAAAGGPPGGSSSSSGMATFVLQQQHSAAQHSTRFFSHTAAYRGVMAGSAAATSAAATSAAAAAVSPAQRLIIPEAAAAATATANSSKAAAAAALSADRALASSLQAATAAITHSGGSSSSSGVQQLVLPGCMSQQGTTAAAAVTRPGFVATAGLILREEGPTAFTRGIQASATRAVLNGGIRLGLYDPIKTLMSVDGSGRDLHMGQKLLAGSISGGIGAVLTTPIELAKTRLQAPSAATRSMSAVLSGVVQQQGLRGLWRGATPSVLRLILLNSSMVATYDEVKGHIRSLTGWSSGLPLVLSSSMVAGLVTTTVINPADVARAYMQTGRGDSLVGVARHILEREGPRGFLKGWTAAYCRTGPQTLIIFSVSELVRPLFGLAVIGGSG